MADDALEVEVLIVGAGPGGLSAGIRLMQLAKEQNRELNVTVIEKGRQVGAHILSGAILDPRAINELLPDWRTEAPIESDVKEDHVWYLNEHDVIPLPEPPVMSNHGNVIVTLSQFTRWLAKKAEALGVNIFCGFPGEKLVVENGRVVGVKCRDMGIDKHGEKKPNWEPGAVIKAKVVILSEGTLGTLAREAIKTFKLDQGRNPQVWATGVKEIWQLPEGHVPPGRVIHTMGYPLGKGAFGGSFIYSMANNRLNIGLVVGLDYEDAYLDIHHELQRLKLHPKIQAMIEGGKMVEYGAKTIPEGGYFSIPKLSMPGALLVGDSASLVNVMRLKGVHLAIKSGMLAAETAFDHIAKNTDLVEYERRFRDSWAHEELWKSRYFKQGFRFLHSRWIPGAIGQLIGMVNVGIMQMLGGFSPVGKKLAAGHTHMKKKKPATQPERIKFDEKITFPKLTSVYYAGSVHEEDQPCHLVVPDRDLCVNQCTVEYGNPCQHFCPANVYEWVTDETAPKGRLQIGFSNCVHCKTCDIMDPYQNIRWVVPEGGGGPNYQNL